MASTTFSARVGKEKLALANQLAQQQLGMSFGQYCGTVLLDMVCDQKAFPVPSAEEEGKKRAAFASMKAFCKNDHDASIAALSDAQIKDLIAGRYA